MILFISEATLQWVFIWSFLSLGNTCTGQYLRICHSYSLILWFCHFQIIMNFVFQSIFFYLNSIQFAVMVAMLLIDINNNFLSKMPTLPTKASCYAPMIPEWKIYILRYLLTIYLILVTVLNLYSFEHFNFSWVCIYRSEENIP